MRICIWFIRWFYTLWEFVGFPSQMDVDDAMFRIIVAICYFSMKALFSKRYTIQFICWKIYINKQWQRTLKWIWNDEDNDDEEDDDDDKNIMMTMMMYCVEHKKTAKSSLALPIRTTLAWTHRKKNPFFVLNNNKTRENGNTNRTEQDRAKWERLLLFSAHKHCRSQRRKNGKNIEVNMTYVLSFQLFKNMRRIGFLYT